MAGQSAGKADKLTCGDDHPCITRCGRLNEPGSDQVLELLPGEALVADKGQDRPHGADAAGVPAARPPPRVPRSRGWPGTRPPASPSGVATRYSFRPQWVAIGVVAPKGR